MALEPDALIGVARTLAAGGNAGSPSVTTDTELRRAVSCAYYAIFHTLCRAYADVMAGPHLGSQLGRDAWNMAYRSIDHGLARSKCSDGGNMRRFGPNIQDFAGRFVELQQRRHEADYDPGTTFTQSQVNRIIDDAEGALMGFDNAPPDEIRLFITYLTSRPRRP
ncbi:MAG: hypothetical protein OXL37_11100 [Chloroflexota bacterium]|nr:hypothetical protein [Chloroflexota bacterium]MDE2959504.1 hypothetical protein [Chloroflexota bacterium]